MREIIRSCGFVTLIALQCFKEVNGIVWSSVLRYIIQRHLRVIRIEFTEEKNMENETLNQASVQEAEQIVQEAEQSVQKTETAPKKSRKQLRKEKKLAKKQARKQLRKEIRQRKKDEFRAKGCLGKIFWFFGKLLSMIFAVALIATVIQVNYAPVTAFLLKLYLNSADADASLVTQEQIDAVLPVDAEHAEAIDASAPIGEGETWAIYMYMVGSNLEANDDAQLSEATKYFTSISAANYADKQNASNRTKLTNFMREIMDKGMDLPLFFYKKNVPDIVPDWLNTAMENVGANINLGNSYMASADIYEMLEVKLPENVKVVFQTGGAGNWKYEKINPNRTQRFVYDHNGVEEVYNEQITGSGRTETLADFLRYCKNEHPADHTMVLFWNHGAGAFGFGADMLFGGEGLSLKDMRAAFENVCVPNEENPPFDVIGFDACLMASMEVADAFNGFARYLVGSEDVEPGYGWDYTAWLGAMANQPRINPLQLCKAITDSYITFYTRSGIASKQPATQLFSVMDLSKADDLSAAYGRLMARALDDSAESANVAALLGKCANRSIKYAGGDHNYFNTLDLGLFMKEAAQYYPDEANAVLELVDEMVLYNLACGVYAQSMGITVFYPSTITDLYGIRQTLTYIDEITDNEDIRALYYYKIAGCLRDDMQDYAAKMGYGEIKPMDNVQLRAMINAQITIDADQNYTIANSSDAVNLSQTIEYNLLQVMESGSARRLGSGAFTGVNEAGDLQTEFNGKWLHIDGTPVAVQVISATDSMVTCSAKISFEYALAHLLLGFDVQNKTWEILGVQKENVQTHGFVASRYTEELKPGDTIAAVYETYDMETGMAGTQTSDEITYTENTKVEEITLKDGQYISFVTMTDARGDEYNLPTVSFDLKDGKLLNSVVGESRNMLAL